MAQEFSIKGFNLISIPDPENQRTHEEFKSEIIQYSYKIGNIRIVKIGSSIDEFYRFSVLLIDNIKGFWNIKKYINASRFDSSGFHIVILLDGTLKDVTKIFEKFWSKNIPNVVVLTNINGTVLLDFDPFNDPSRCGNTIPSINNIFLNGKFAERLNLIKRFKNMNHCPIVATTFYDGVASFKEVLPNGTIIIRGYESHMIKTLAKMLNFSLDYKFRDGYLQWGSISENGSCSATLCDLKEGKTDIAIGNYFLREERMKFFDSSSSYISYPIFLLLSPAKKLNSFEKLLSPFESNVWILICLTLFVGIFSIFIINFKVKFLKQFIFGYGINCPLTNMFGAIIGIPQSMSPKKSFPRFLLMMFVLLCLVLRSAYQGSLFKFLQSDGRHRDPQTVDELIKNDYVFIVGGSNNEVVKKYHKNLKTHTVYVDQEKYFDLDYFIASSSKSALFTSKMELMHYSQTHDSLPYKICKEYFFMVNIVMYFRKNFFLKKAIDEASQWILTAGLLDHWMNRYDGTKKWRRVKIKPSVMTIDHLSGAFYLLLIGNSIGLIVFVFELFVRKKFT